MNPLLKLLIISAVIGAISTVIYDNEKGLKVTCGTFVVLIMLIGLIRGCEQGGSEESFDFDGRASSSDMQQ